MNERINQAANEIISEAVNNIAERLPDDNAKQNFVNRVEHELQQATHAALTGQDYQQNLNRGAYETSVWLAQHYADVALNRVVSELSRGKTRDTVHNYIELIAHRGIESLCRGASLDEIKRDLADCTIDQLKSHATPEIADFIYRGLKTDGKGSRAVNRHIKAGSNIVATELAGNVGDWIGGRKNLSDVVVDTAKGSAVKWGKGQGAELAAETFRSLAKTAEREIQNKLIRDVSTKALTSLSSANTLTQAAGYVIDIGQSLRQLFNGEITKAEFLRIVGEKGTAFVLSGSLSAIGAIAGSAAGPIGTWIGGAIGSMVGYFATSCLFGSVMRAFEEAELSRKRYEMIREFCEESIREMEAQRIEFERNVREFLGSQQAIFDLGLKDYEASLKANDIDGMTSALNDIAKAFGRELQFQTFDEFDAFMSNPNSTFKL